MSSFKAVATITFIILIAGCAKYEMPAPATSHPAHPDAQTTPLDPVATTLAIDEENLPQTPPEFKRHKEHIQNKKSQQMDTPQQMP
ncbi:hypothetical protein STSP2_01288 [Anaerohalosphaera lusitana]|uniref:Lipoprotein n=1 Tax=Anaerohalosphaera lusitana TaxID=1936003 RepID=A0A1U9NJM1_9BACT|nr:hypothetical protein [Anaerohalosphaera lusitana]AQT68133.1 hypothetical protein STSP2_01288 [Anaerohalosphaera lusitana]